MKSLVVYDSNFGNTKSIAEVIAKELGENSKAISVSDFKNNDLKEVSLIVAGSPINGWRPSERMEQFLATLKKGQLQGLKATSFDTRVNVFFHGDAAKKISNKLQSAGAEIISPPQVFYVKGTKGPIVEGEVDKAKEWARRLKNNL